MLRKGSRRLWTWLGLLYLEEIARQAIGEAYQHGVCVQEQEKVRRLVVSWCCQDHIIRVRYVDPLVLSPRDSLTHRPHARAYPY